MTIIFDDLFRRPIEPQIFLRRAMICELIIAFIQLCHLWIFSKANTYDFVIWLLVHGVAQLLLAILRYPARRCTEYFFIPWKILSSVILVTFVFKIFSRLPYIDSWISMGLFATRHNPDFALGGWYTYGSVFFYPASILLAFSTMPRNMYRILLLGVLVICCIDFVAIGTRNAPIFVLMFYLLAMPTRFNRKSTLLFSLLLTMIFVAIFNYSTVNRTYASQQNSFDWIELFEYTNSTEVLKIDREVVAPIAESAPEIMPVIFLSHYLGHSIGELRHFINISSDLSLGGLYGLKDQLCVIGVCDRSTSQADIAKSNPRAGVYQTLWTSLILDFGFFGSFLIFFFTFILLCSIQLSSNKLGFSTIFFTQLIMLSSIENYLYNGLGFIQCLLIFLLIPALKFFRIFHVRPS